MQALDDINVVSLAQIYNGPYFALMLSYLGVDVVKLESPGGEVHRSDDGADLRPPCVPVRERDEVLYDPHLEGRGMVTEIDHPNFGEIRVPGMPIRLHGSEYPDIEPAPMPGQDNAEVYRELGLTADGIEQFEEDSVI